MKKYIFLILLAALSSPFYFACNEPTPTTPTPPTYTCDQECQDGHVAYGFVDCFWFIWNQHIAGQPSGQKDLTVNGPHGGTIHIYGTTAVSNNGINTVHLTYDMTNCKSMNQHYNLTFTGSMSCDGTFSSSYTAMGYTCDSLIYSGTVCEKTNTQVSGFCPVTIAEETNGLSGTICGRSFAYSYGDYNIEL